MAHLYFLLGLGLLVLLALARQVWRLTSNWLHPPYLADATLFTPAQRRLKIALEQAVGRDYRIYGRVRVAEVIGVHGRLTRREQERALARLDGLCFDFLLCTPETTALVGAIALLPRSRWPGTAVTMRRLQRICTAANLPLLGFYDRDDYPVAEMAQQIFAVLQTRWLGSAPEVTAVRKPADDDAQNDRPELVRREPTILELHDLDAAPELQIDARLELPDNDHPRISGKRD